MVGKSICYFYWELHRNDYPYLLNCKDEAIEMSRQCNIEVENQCEKKLYKKW